MLSSSLWSDPSSTLSSSSSSSAASTVSSSTSCWNAPPLCTMVFSFSNRFCSSNPARLGSSKVNKRINKNVVHSVAIKYPGMVNPLNCIHPSTGSLAINSILVKSTAIAGPMADPAATTIPKLALTDVRKLSGVVSAMYRRIMHLGAPKPAMRRPISAIGTDLRRSARLYMTLPRIINVQLMIKGCLKDLLVHMEKGIEDKKAPNGIIPINVPERASCAPNRFTYNVDEGSTM